MVEILLQLVEAEILRNARHAPWLGHRLEGAEQDFAGILLVVGAFVGHPQHRQAAETGDRLGDDVEMLAGVQRHRDAGHRADLMRPHACAVDNVVAGDGGDFAIQFGAHASHPPVGFQNVEHLGLLENLRALVARALGERVGDVGGIALAVLVEIDRARDIRDVQMRIAPLDFRRVDLLDADAIGARHAGPAQNLLAALAGQSHGDRAAAAESGRDAGLLFQRAIELLAVFGEPCHVGGGAQLRDQAGGVPCRAAGQLLALQQHDVGPAELGEMIGDGAARDAAADDDDAGLGGQGLAHARILALAASHMGWAGCTMALQSVP